jgi:hypothetical protein
MQLKESEKEHLKNWGFDKSEIRNIEINVVQTGAGSLHNFQRYCLKAVEQLTHGQKIVWPPTFQNQEVAK